MNWAPFILSFKLAFITAILLFAIGVPLAFWLNHLKRKRLAIVIESILSLPLVLPPTVIGFYLLVMLSPNSGLGGFLDQNFNIRLVFTFPGLVLGSLIYSLPFMVQPLLTGFRSLPANYYRSAQLMGKTNMNILRKVLLPNMKPAILSGLVLSFAHTVGEFGIVLMVGGNIPTKTRVASVAIYDAVEMMDYAQAHIYSVLLVAMSFVVLTLAYSYQRRPSKLVL